MELQGYAPYESNTPRTITSKDKFVFVKGGHEKVVTILLTRRKNLIVRVDGETSKFELMFTTWTQEDGLPMIHGGGQLFLWVPNDAPAADAPVRAPRAKAAPGETKIAKCRAIFAANKDLDKDAMIAKFVADAGCTPQGAVTYYITCRKG
jgi:hypothetical protein